MPKINIFQVKRNKDLFKGKNIIRREYYRCSSIYWFHPQRKYICRNLNCRIMEKFNVSFLSSAQIQSICSHIADYSGVLFPISLWLIIRRQPILFSWPTSYILSFVNFVKRFFHGYYLIRCFFTLNCWSIPGLIPFIHRFYTHWPVSFIVLGLIMVFRLK